MGVLTGFGGLNSEAGHALIKYMQGFLMLAIEWNVGANLTVYIKLKNN